MKRLLVGIIASAIVVVGLSGCRSGSGEDYTSDPFGENYTNDAFSDSGDSSSSVADSDPLRDRVTQKFLQWMEDTDRESGKDLKNSDLKESYDCLIDNTIPKLDNEQLQELEAALDKHPKKLTNLSQNLQVILAKAGVKCIVTGLKKVDLKSLGNDPSISRSSKDQEFRGMVIQKLRHRLLEVAQREGDDVNNPNHIKLRKCLEDTVESGFKDDELRRLNDVLDKYPHDFDYDSPEVQGVFGGAGLKCLLMEVQKLDPNKLFKD